MKKYGTCLITGASRGLGYETALLLAKSKRVENFILVARDKERLDELKKTLKEKAGHTGGVETVALDLVDEKDVQKACALGACSDLVINNAGVGFVNHFESMSTKDIHHMMMLNNSALTLITHASIKGMLERNKGEIVNIASVAGFMPLSLFSVYAATKAFVVSLTYGLDGEFKERGIRVKAFCPGGMRTDFHRSAGLLDRIVEDNGFFMETVEQSAKDVLSLLDSNGTVYVPRMANKFLALSSSLIPKKLSALSSWHIYKNYIKKTNPEKTGSAAR